MLNQIVLVGRVVKDLDVKTLEDGKKVSDLILAIQRPFKNYSGQYDTDFVKISLWDQLAALAQNYCKKGNMVAVKGRVQVRKIENEEEKTSFLEVIGERVSYLTSSKKEFDEKTQE